MQVHGGCDKMFESENLNMALSICRSWRFRWG